MSITHTMSSPSNTASPVGSIFQPDFPGIGKKNDGWDRRRGEEEAKMAGYWISSDVHTGWVSGDYGFDTHDLADLPVNPAEHGLASQSKAYVSFRIR